MIDLMGWTIKTCGKPIRGVLHIGANSGQEARAYSEMGLKVVWVEADPRLYQALQSSLQPFAGQTALLCLASDVDGQEVDFHIASNDGGSSSVLPFDVGRFASEWPEITEAETIRLPTCRLDTLFAREHVDLRGVNLIVADVQGYELPVLRGLGDRLREFDVVMSEVNWQPIYRGATKPHELEAFLASRGFSRMWLGVSDLQSTGVWVQRASSAWDRLVMVVTVWLYLIASRVGLVRVLRRVGILELGRRMYCAVKGRANR
jgi:FkbM family methyltransferase